MGINIKAGNPDGPEGSDPGAWRQPVRARLDHLPPPKFRVLLVGHHPQCSPVATLVLAATIAINGLRVDGSEMPGRTDDRGSYDAGRPATLRAIANELGLHVDAARRGAEELESLNVATRCEDGLLANRDAVAARWGDHRRRIRLTAEDRRRGLRAEPLLLVGLVCGQAARNGRLVLGLGYLAERTGLPRRTLQRALATACKAGALHRWIAPLGRGQLVIAIGPSQSGARVASQSGARVEAYPPVPTRHAGGRHREAAHLPSQSGAAAIVSGRTPHRETAHAPPDVLPEHPPDHLPDGTAAAAPGDPIVPTLKAAAEQPAAPAKPASTRNPALGAIEEWIIELRRRNVERLDPASSADCGTIANLLGRLDLPGDRLTAAIVRERLQFASEVIRWCPQPERLARWLCRVVRWLRAERPGAYLRRAVERGRDHSTLLGVRSTWRDFSKATERALEGDYAGHVEKLVELCAVARRADVDEVERDRLRAEFAHLLAHKRPVAARAVLLRLVGSDRSDAALARAVGDAAPMAEVKHLLGLVA